MRTEQVTKVWEFYRDNCAGYKEPMRKQLRELDEHVDHIEAENAELRERMELLTAILRNDCDIDASWDGLRLFWSIELTESGCLMRDRACKAEAENAKLRKLVRDMWHQSCTYDTTCDGCPRYVKHWDGTEECEFETRIIKLGIEVGYEW